jgi:hypothetical protein
LSVQGGTLGGQTVRFGLKSRESSTNEHKKEQQATEEVVAVAR